MQKNRGVKEVWVEKICQNIISIGTFLILFTPLIINTNFFFPFVGPKSLYFMGLVEIIFFAWLFLIFFSPKFRPRFNLILGSIILFLIILIISAFQGVDPFYSFWSKFERMTGLLMMFHLLVFFLVFSSSFEELDWRRIFAVSLFVGVIISFIALTSDNPAMRGGATIGNDSFLGTYLLFNLFLAMYLIFKDEFKTYSSVCFSIMFLALFLSGARAAQLSFLGGIILLAFLWLAFYQRGNLRLVGIFLLVFSLLLALYFTFSALQPESFVRKQIIEKTVGGTFGGRFIVWQKAWENFLERPFLGWGPESFEFAFTTNYNPCMGTAECGADVWYDRAHNIIYDTLVTSGILGMLSYFGIFISTFYVLWKKYFRQEFDFWITSIFTVLLISYSIQNLTVFDMVSSFMMFFMTLGFVAGMSQKETIEAEAESLNVGALVLVSILILVLFSISFLNFVILPFKTDSLIISATRAEPFSEEKLFLYKRALYSSPVGRYQVREFFVDTALGALSNEIPKEAVTREFDFLAQELEKSLEENSLNYRSQLKLARLYNVYSKFDFSKIAEAEKVLKKAIELSPTNQQAYWQLAQTMLYQGKPDEALSLAEKAVELEPRHKSAHFILVEIASIKGDIALAEKKIQEAIEINPEWEEDLRKGLKKL